jgi:hypothetical protein
MNVDLNGSVQVNKLHFYDFQVRVWRIRQVWITLKDVEF